MKYKMKMVPKIKKSEIQYMDSVNGKHFWQIQDPFLLLEQ
jgi:hypothetical protein